VFQGFPRSTVPLFFVALFLALLLSPIASAQQAVPPFAHLKYCATQPGAHCRLIDGVRPADASFVNLSINENMTAADDVGFDEWTVFPADRRGDCDDFVVSKRAVLIAFGMAPEDLRIAAGKAIYPDGRVVDHLVLEVTFGGRVLVLDNVIREVPKNTYWRDETPYKWQPTATMDPARAAWRMN
jgi:predicted transglutaminase-like cysteine proteinase